MKRNKSLELLERFCPARELRKSGSRCHFILASLHLIPLSVYKKYNHFSLYSCKGYFFSNGLYNGWGFSSSAKWKSQQYEK